MMIMMVLGLFEVDTDFDLDDDAGTIEFNMLLGNNCEDNDDDGNDADVNEDGYFNPVLDRGRMSQGYLSPTYYDVDNDNDGVPDTEDPDDDNDGRLDVDQEALPGCFWEKNHHLGIMTITAFQIGRTWIGMETDVQMIGKLRMDTNQLII